MCCAAQAQDAQLQQAGQREADLQHQVGGKLGCTWWGGWQATPMGPDADAATTWPHSLLPAGSPSATRSIDPWLWCPCPQVTVLQARLPASGARVQPLDPQQASRAAATAATAAAQVSSLEQQLSSAQASLRVLRGERDQLQQRLEQAVADAEGGLGTERRAREVLRAQLATAQEAAQLATQVGGRGGGRGACWGAW